MFIFLGKCLDNHIDKLYLELRSRLIYQVMFWNKTNYVEQLRGANCVEFICKKNTLQRSLLSTIYFFPKQRFDKLNTYIKKFEDEN